MKWSSMFLSSKGNAKYNHNKVFLTHQTGNNWVKTSPAAADVSDKQEGDLLKSFMESTLSITVNVKRLTTCDSAAPFLKISLSKV